MLSAPQEMLEKTLTGQKHTARRSAWLEFLGSMNLAITLLVAVAIASVIGTVLQQNQPYQDYIVKFGQFWFQVFDLLGLYDVYSAGWFLLILTFLVASTSVCIYRNAPTMWRDMRSYRTRVERKSLRAFHQQREWLSDTDREQLAETLRHYLRQHRFRFRERSGEDFLLLAASRGAFSRLGYLFTHAAIVIICLGALFDGNLPLKLREMRGELKPETRDLPATQVPAISRLSVKNPSFRGSVRVPEGSSADVVFLQLRDGYLVQPLPFTVAVKDFRIQHYSTGQPKAFESDLVIEAPDLEQPLEQTIAVNHPLIFRGYAIYQASFSDGGTGLSLLAWPLNSQQTEPQPLEGRVFESREVDTPDGRLSLEFTDFRMFNINPVQGEDGQVEQKNFGPLFTYKLRDETGQALEYENYMSPVPFNDRLYFLTGVRGSPAEPFRYLHIPADSDASVRRFQRFNALLHDRDRVLAAARRATENTLAMAAPGTERPGVTEEVIQSMVQLVAHFRRGGFEAIAQQVEDKVPESERERVLTAYMKVLQTLLGELYLELLGEEGVDLSAGLGEQEEQFFDDVVNTLSALGQYASPFYLQLKSFDFVQASGLQIARAPGKNVVYLGFALLIAGVFLMFYVPTRRLWFWIDCADGRTRLLAAGTGQRHQRDFEKEFSALASQLDDYLTAGRQAGGNSCP